MLQEKAQDVQRDRYCKNTYCSHIHNLRMMGQQ